MGPSGAYSCRHFDPAVPELAEAEVIVFSLTMLMKALTKASTRPARRMQRRLSLVQIFENEVMKNRVPSDAIRSVGPKGSDVLKETRARLAVQGSKFCNLGCLDRCVTFWQYAIADNA